MAAGSVKTASWLIFLWAKKPHLKPIGSRQKTAISNKKNLFGISLKIFKVIVVATFVFPIIALIFAVRFEKSIMANHKSAEKRIRANETKRVRNRYQAKSTRTQIKKLNATTKKDEAQALLKEVSSMIDKLAKKNIIHWKKAANQKSQLTKRVNALA